jgi:DNA-binding LytR/AlgR family response regulator
MQKILIDQILYFESWKDYVKVFLTGGRELLVKQPISTIANLLAEHSFLRVHRSYIVSIRQITGYSHVQIQIQQTQIPIGRFYKRQTMEALEGVN